ncbi:hypothetical protein GCM10010199_72010 [Dactylosporangium roseum]
MSTSTGAESERLQRLAGGGVFISGGDVHDQVEPFRTGEVGGGLDLAANVEIANP